MPRIGYFGADSALKPNARPSSRYVRARVLNDAVTNIGIETLESRLMFSLGSPFGAAVFTPLPGTPTIIAGPGGVGGQPLMDLNGDGTGDMIVQYNGVLGITSYRDVSALLMNADGTSTEYRIARYDVPDNIDQVIVTDLNHDGHMDVVVMHTDSIGETVIDFFMGQSNGTFTNLTPSINLGTVQGTPVLTVFDATGDSIPDLFLQMSALKVTVYPGNGDGTFGTPATTTFPLDSQTGISFQTDVTGDGIPDVVVSGDVLNGLTLSGGLAVFKGTSTGAYNTTPTFSDYTDGLSFQALRNLSSNTLPDIVAYSSTEDFPGQAGEVMVFKNNGGGSFTKDFTSPSLTGGFDSEIPEGGDQFMPLFTPQLTSDGRNDMLLFDGGIFSTTLTVHVEQNDGASGFTNIENFTLGNFASNSTVVVADVDGDGLPDLVISQSGSEAATIFFNNGSGGFITPGVQLTPTDTTEQVRVIDLTNDGKMDVIFTSFPTVGPNTFDEFINQTGRTFSSDIQTPDNGTVLLQADSNTHLPADPALDYRSNENIPVFLAYANNGPTLGDSEGFTPLIGTSTGGFFSLTPSITFGATVTVAESPLAGDINNDGAIDLVFVASADGQNDSAGIYVVMNGSHAPVSSAGTASATATALGIVNASTAFNEFMTATSPGQSFFTFTTTTPQTVRIAVTPDAGDIDTMLLSGSSGFESATVGLAAVGPEGSFFHEYDLPAGTYTLELDHGQGADTHYRLDIEFPPEAQQITVLQGLNALASGQNTINFGAVEVTTTDTQKFFTVRNDGESTLTFTGLTLPNGFSAGEDALPATLAPGASATFSLVMNATGPGQFSGDVLINSNDPDTPAFDLPVQGTVTGAPLVPGISVKLGAQTITSGQGTPIQFPATGLNATSVTFTFTLTNTGTGPLTLGQLGLSATGFQIETENFNNPLAPGATGTVSVIMLTGQAGMFSANLTIPTNTSIGTFLVPLAGTVTNSGPSAQVASDGDPLLNGATTADHLNGTWFGDANQGTAQVVHGFQIINNGATPLTVSHLTVTGGFKVVGTPAGTVPAHGFITVNIAMPTTTIGDLSGTVTFDTNDPNNSVYSFVIAGGVISAAPTIDSLAADDNVAQGTTLTLTAMEVIPIAPATIKTVKFYLDSLGTGIFNASKDKVLGTGKVNVASHSYALSINAATLGAGAQTYFAVATDSKGRTSNVVSTQDTILPFNAPTIGSPTANPTSVERGDKATFTAPNVVDDGDTVQTVEFYLGVPGDDGDFNVNADTLMGKGKLISAATHTYSLQAKIPLNQTLGVYPVYAVAISKHGNMTERDANDLTIIDVPPVIKTMSATPAKIAPDNNITIKLTGVSDADGTVTAVNVYWSSSGSTASTANAVLLGQAHHVSGTTWTFTGPVPKANDMTNPFPTSGPVIFLAQAMDNSGGLSGIIPAQATAVPQLAVGQLNIAPTPIVHTAAVTFTASGVTGSPKTVQFWIMAGSVSVLDTSTATLLGNGVKKSAGAWTLSLKNLLTLTPGSYTVFVRAEDSSGNFGEPLFADVTVD